MLRALQEPIGYRSPSLDTRSNKVVYRCTFHVVWCPKYCRPVITGPVDLRLKEIIREVCAERDAPIVELETVPDHVQLLVTCDPQFGIHRLVKQSKGRSSWLLRQEFPSLKSKLPTLWTNSYFVANSGWGDIGGRQPLRREPTQCLTDALTPTAEARGLWGASR